MGKNFLVFDGAMGTMLQAAGLKLGESSETFNLTHPDVVYDIHKMYIDAGSQVITTNTFGASQLKLLKSGYSVEMIINAAVKIAKKAAGDKKVALDIGPTGFLVEPLGELTFEKAYEIFKRQMIAGESAGADLILIETMSDLYEVRAAVLAAKENTKLPVYCTMTFQENGRTLTGTDPFTMVNVLEALGVDAVGVNCSLGPKELMNIVEEILKYSSIPVMVQPNAGLPEMCCGETVFGVSPEEFADYMRKMAEKGVSILGGCCGTKPEYIKAVVERIKDIVPVSRKVPKVTAVSSYSETVILGEGVKVIGERINPTGKKKFKEALRNNDLDYILNEAISQKKAGADILDVNVGLPEIDELSMMVKAVKSIQSVVTLPLQIDSAMPEVIEAAVRVYNGKPIINSVNGKEEIMEQVFPIVKKYGACVIGLTLDENGIPGSAEERFKVAEKIVNKASEYGIPRENILIDCLVLTASAQQKEVMETLRAVRMVKEKLGVKTLLGVSNVSFGLPNRGILNRTYLAMALAFGLDAPIINPLSQEIMDTINSFKVLSFDDKNSKNYIEIYGGKASSTVIEEKKADLKEIVIQGMKEIAGKSTEELLKEITPMQIVDEYLIPALDSVGKMYEVGEIFLPQLIQSAETVNRSFAIIKKYMNSSGEEKISKGKILLATVKGDVHDIGKNIVKVLLENYGYDIVDLGKDVSKEAVVEKVKEENIKLVGLSALMTTTVRSMEETINAIRKEKLDCTVMVGGAVLNEEYASSIGADYYAKDARDAVKIAQKVLKKFKP